MVVSYVQVNGFDEFDSYTEGLNPNGAPVLLYFSGSKSADGNSWCPDCVEAEPVVKAFLGELDREAVFVYVDVGDREYWKDRACPFRTDPRTKLMVIPTIIKWNGVQRLEGNQCNNRDLLEMLFEDE